MLDEIITPRLIIRNIQPNDVSSLIRLWTNKQVRKYLGGPIEQVKAEKRANNYVGKEGHFCITDLHGAEILGLCSIDKYRTGEIEVSYELLPKAWGKGFGREAVLAMVKWGFENMNIDHIIAVTQTQNHKSRKLLESIGMLAIDEFVEYNESQTKYTINPNDISF